MYFGGGVGALLALPFLKKFSRRYFILLIKIIPDHNIEYGLCSKYYNPHSEFSSAFHLQNAAGIVFRAVHGHNPPDY